MGGRRDNFYTVFHFITRFEKGNQIRGKSLCFRSGAQKHGSVSVAERISDASMGGEGAYFIASVVPWKEKSPEFGRPKFDRFTLFLRVEL